ncbi:MAG: DUF547 domain-containing protein [Nitrospina sp.]|jgi:hypothetical protein|nr:DUF547 domain-containing protein [Nitrospina sp.]MBT6600412.1 DUF547 domain-containing protein [Nitrospina sp.]
MSTQGSLINKFLKFFLIPLFFLVSSTNVQAFDFSDWDLILKKYIKSGLVEGVSINTVAYGELMKDPIFHRLVNNLKISPLSRLTTKDEKLAFWINVYNIFAVKVVTDNYPLSSIKDVGGLFKSVWKIRAGTVNRKEYSLGEIEHGILRKIGDPRIHSAIVCASISCPDLSIEVYKSEKIDYQLDLQMRKFLANPNKGMRIEDNKPLKIFLSPIFDWFADDFESRGGVLNFIKPYVLPEYKSALNNLEYSILYMDYNWSINGS